MGTAILAHRYFFAALPDPVSAARIHAWAERTLGPYGMQGAERLHVTLAITDDFAAPQSSLVEALIRAGERLAAAPFDLLLDRLSIGGRSIALRSGHIQPAMRELQARIARALAAEGTGMRQGWRFSPHVTLGYRESPSSTQPVANLGWTVSEVALIHSLVGVTRHEILGRWPLDPRPDPQLSLFSA
jgi:2'-5' RNA ligase